jgi:hypothetical protein
MTLPRRALAVAGAALACTTGAADQCGCGTPLGLLTSAALAHPWGC